MSDLLPNIDATQFQQIAPERLTAPLSDHTVRILLLYGSLRERSYSRLLVEEAARILRALGAETRILDPRGLPLPDAAAADHPKVVELRKLSEWSEGQVWCSPERHGAITGVIKTQIDGFHSKAQASGRRKVARFLSCKSREARNRSTQ
ncbi:NAD(P)H-dependent oxidoreductase [Cupriavidus basilensis]